jgi:rRNA maturation protein Nop10
LKKCQECGSLCLDQDVLCGICGSDIANTPTLRGSIEDEVLRDRKEAERQSSLVKERLARWSKRRLLQRLLVSITAIVIGSATIIFGAAYGFSLIQAYGGYAFLVGTFSAVGGFTLILLGFRLSMKGGTYGSLPSMPSAVSNLTMRATYEGRLLPEEQQDRNERSS